MNNYDNPLHHDHPSEGAGWHKIIQSDPFMTGAQFDAQVQAIVNVGGVTPNVGAGAEQLFTPFADAGGINVTGLSYNSASDSLSFAVAGALHTDSFSVLPNLPQTHGTWGNLAQYEFAAAVSGASASAIFAGDSYMDNLNSEVGWPPYGVNVAKFGTELLTGGFGPGLQWSMLST